MVGSALQFGVQLPVVLALTRRLRLRLDTAAANVREVLRNFAPVFVSRGVVQISALRGPGARQQAGEGAVAALTNAQSIYILAGEPLRHGGVGGRTAGDVERARHAKRKSRRACAGA